MNKKLVVIIVAVVATIGLGAIYLMGASSPDNESTSSTAVSNEVQMDAIESSQSVETDAGVYKEYDEADLSINDDTKILFFHAAWCPQCRELEMDIKDGPIPENVTIYKVDYDTNQSLRKKYGVALQTTLVKIDNNGNLLKKYVAYDDPSLDSLTTNLLQ